jgi:hypothetical protein
MNTFGFNGNGGLNTRVALLENEKPVIYGALFEGSVSAGTRTDDAVGMVANVGVDNEVVLNDFDSVPFFNRPACNVYFDANGNPIVMAYEGEPGFSRQGAIFPPYAYEAECFYEETPFYWNGSLDHPRISGRPVSGFTLAPRFSSPTQKEYSPCYRTSTVGGKATSRSGLQPTYHSLNTGMEVARAFHSNGHTETMKARITDYILQLVEFANRDFQTIMMGAANMRYNNASDVSILAENGVNRIVVSVATASNYVVGQSISIGTASNGEQISARVIITDIVDEGTDKAIEFDGSPLNIPLGAFISSRAWVNGATDGVRASSGSIVSNSSGFYPCKYRNNENPWGNIYSVICDVLTTDLGAIYVLPDPTKYNAGAITSDYVLLDYTLPLSDGYVSEFQFDARYPYVVMPKTLGGSNVTYMGAYYYYPRPSVAVSFAGGHFLIGRRCSSVFFILIDSPATVDFARASRLFVSRS